MRQILFPIYTSFICCQIDRQLTPINHTRSHCESCEKTLKWFDLIPIVSFLLLKGHCRYCQNKISTTNFIFELVSLLIPLNGLTLILWPLFISDFKYNVFYTINLILLAFYLYITLPLTFYGLNYCYCLCLLPFVYLKKLGIGDVWLLIIFCPILSPFHFNVCIILSCLISFLFIKRTQPIPFGSGWVLSYCLMVYLVNC